MGIHIIEGKPEIGANLLASFVKRHPDYDYNVVEITNETCTLEFYEGDRKLGESNFTVEDAKRAGLVKPKGNWEKWPRNMCFARALSNGVRWYMPDVTAGYGFYTEGEIVEATDVVELAAEGQLPDIPRREEVAAIVERARAQNHVGLSDVATIQMTLTGASEERVDAWLQQAEQELERLETSSPREAADEEGADPSAGLAGNDTPDQSAPPEAPDEDSAAYSQPAERAAALERRANDLIAQGEDAQHRGDHDRAEHLFAEAESLRDAAGAVVAKDQTNLDV